MSLRTAKYPNSFKHILICAIATLLSVPSAHALDKVVSGQVRDYNNKVLEGIKVALWNTDNSVSLTTKTDAKGKFSFTHEKCGPLFLEVFAPKESNMASALVDDVPGDEARSVIITLKKGWPVTGRVLCNGKGLKGIVVKAYSKDHHRDQKARIYGGGAVETERGGRFSLTLTPGDKKIVLLNKKYDKVAKSANISTKVISDTDLGDLEMPAVRAPQ